MGIYILARVNKDMANKTTQDKEVLFRDYDITSYSSKKVIGNEMVKDTMDKVLKLGLDSN